METLENLASLHLFADQPAEALPLLKRAREGALRTLDPDHPLLAGLLFHEAKALRMLGQLVPASQQLESAISSVVRLYGPASPSTLMYLEEKIRLLKLMNQPAEALDVSRNFLETMETIFGADSPHLAAGILEHTDLLLQLGPRREARAAFDRGLALEEPGRSAETHLATLRFHARLADDLGHPSAAELHARVHARSAGGS